MNIEKLMGAVDVIGWLIEEANKPGEEPKLRNQMALNLSLARLYVVEYAAHIQMGAKPDEALLSTLRGELE